MLTISDVQIKSPWLSWLHSRHLQEDTRRRRTTTTAAAAPATATAAAATATATAATATTTTMTMTMTMTAAAATATTTATTATTTNSGCSNLVVRQTQQNGGGPHIFKSLSMCHFFHYTPPLTVVFFTPCLSRRTCSSASSGPTWANRPGEDGTEGTMVYTVDLSPKMGSTPWYSPKIPKKWTCYCREHHKICSQHFSNIKKNEGSSSWQSNCPNDSWRTSWLGSWFLLEEVGWMSNAESRHAKRRLHALLGGSSHKF